MGTVSTFSLVARDAETGDLGIAVASKFLAVGAVVPYAVADIGAVATQSYANTSYGPRVIAALRVGVPLELVHEAFTATDPDHAKRQYGLVDAAGRSVTFTGSECQAWAGGVAGQGFAAQGNLLAGPQVIDAMVEAYASAEGPLPERLMSALVSGEAAGGDRRGRQAAALLVVRADAGYGGMNDRYVDLRVDDDDAPTRRLQRLLELFRLAAKAD